VGAVAAGLLGLVAGLSALGAAGTATQQATPSPVILDAVLYDGQALSDMDEAVAVRNISDAPLDLAGYRLADGAGSVGVISTTTIIAPDQVLWLARDAAAFSREFGFAPDRGLAGLQQCGRRGVAARPVGRGP
jgi:hypothetical protein